MPRLDRLLLGLKGERGDVPGLGADHGDDGGAGDAVVGCRQRGVARHRHPVPERGPL